MQGGFDESLWSLWIDDGSLVRIRITSEFNSVFLMRDLRQRTEIIRPFFIRVQVGPEVFTIFPVKKGLKGYVEEG